MATTIDDAIKATRNHIDSFELRLAAATKARAEADERIASLSESIRLRRKMLEAMEKVQADLGPNFTAYLNP